ncbi:ribose-phosphate pyrophosphokinase [Novimethylophilus kurashikiensis]|uniref:Ribose-phosphate pyrophosphokinase n=1 Tax=Novimethylophilus kurashikiensis TaxID=1825523 RepID=A0A2R5FD69_9PROT|nr:ribose-phosphate diphosphokinase [Novimethylophilus kurashikiensis]GBG14843.1 ribose-phosphate pyrophosphokinase [Novimethylophilus kurashikiensis]
MLTIFALDIDGNGRAIRPELKVFAGGEAHVRIPEDVLEDAERFQGVTISALLKTSDDVMQLLLVTDALRRIIPTTTPISLEMPYVPYARQDRVCNPGESLSARVFCDLINAQNYEYVRITDPHSDVVGALLDRVVIQDASELVQRVLLTNTAVFGNGVTFLAPDAGARKRVLSIARKVGVTDVVFADKVRNTVTGEITGTSFPEVSTDKPILVIDDICDGGRTFLELAKAAQEVGDYELHLYVTHGIFSRGLSELRKHYCRIYTGYDWTDCKDPYLFVAN